MTSVTEFSDVGVVEVDGATFRAHVQWKEKGVKRHCRGPRRAVARALRPCRVRSLGLHFGEPFGCSVSGS